MKKILFRISFKRKELVSKTLAAFLFILIFANCNNPSDEIDKQLNTNGLSTDAITYNYQIEGSRRHRRISVDYTYFVGKTSFTFNKTLNKLDNDFSRFHEPQIQTVVYLKDQPRLHKLLLDFPLDTISNEKLKEFVSEKFVLKRINGLDSIRVRYSDDL